jgi:WXG100 protein secretion system (Wss), protein YukD
VTGPGVDVVHVTVVGGGLRAELSLPRGTPLAELTPALARLCLPESAFEGTPPAWSLARPGAPLELAALGAAAVAVVTRALSGSGGVVALLVAAALALLPRGVGHAVAALPVAVSGIELPG